ncbi:SHOCT domain-containing protein [Desulfosporosinus sp. SB140]|uniref:SHOCT domain-containing protein n=1 Tax=Desulfosporosinus paludis TaxID=3115649 RepID=UPI00388F517E
MMLALIILVIVAYYAFNSSHSGGSCFKGHLAHGHIPLDILDERYARGEINREEYMERKLELSGQKQLVSLKK